jgi:hypothetical protein
LKKAQTWKSKKFRFLLIAGGLVSIAFIIGLVLSQILETKIIAELSRKKGSVGSVGVNVFAKSITVRQLEISNEDGDFHCVFDKIEISGINIFQLLANNHLKIKHLLLDSGSVNYLIGKRDSLNIHSNKPFKYSLLIESVELNKVNFSVTNDSLLELSGSANLSMGRFSYDTAFSIEDLGSRFHHLTGSLSKLVYKEPTGFYTVLADNIHLDSYKHSLVVDSVKLIPNYGKIEFARVLGKQATRVDVSLPRLAFFEIDYKSALSGSLSISRLSIEDSKVYAFRDKRVTFLNDKIVSMPMLSLARLPYKFSIDSISIQKGTIVVEEFAEEAKEPGYVEFNNVQGLMTGLTNQSQNLKPAELIASGNFMKTGLIEAVFTFPGDSTKEYTANGKISNVPLRELNTLTGAAASLEFESGLLNKLYFNFEYNDYKSRGEIQLNYKDLKIVTLNQEGSIQKLKSALINTLLKDTKDKSTPVKDRKGTIEFERDRKRFIFNLWAKSIQAGIKESILGSPKK